MGNELKKRKQLRLPDYDYGSAGYYYITLCSKDRKYIFGKIVGADVLIRPRNYLSPAGIIVDNILSTMENVDKYVVMPNHVHLILKIRENNGTMGTSSPTIPYLVRYIKRSATTKMGYSFWQRGYYDHIIRDEEDYFRIWEYIDGNPSKWLDDEYYI